MKKANNSKKSLSVKKTEKGKESGELRKPIKLKPLKEKEKKNWKKNVDDEDDEDGFMMDEGGIGLDSSFEDSDEEDEGFFDDNY